MKASARLLALAALLLACAGSVAIAQRPDLLLPSCSAADAPSAPCIDKVDPPNWWIDLPSPMLLVHGDHLTGAKFSVDRQKRLDRSNRK